MRSIKGAICNDLVRTLTLFSRSHHSLTLTISQTATDTAIVTIKGKLETAPKFSNGTGFNDVGISRHDIIQRQITRKCYKMEL